MSEWARRVYNIWCAIWPPARRRRTDLRATFRYALDNIEWTAEEINLNKPRALAEKLRRESDE